MSRAGRGGSSASVVSPLLPVGLRQQVSLCRPPEREAHDVHPEAAQGLDLAKDERVRDRGIAAGEMTRSASVVPLAYALDAAIAACTAPR